MKSRLEAIVERREALQARSALQRNWVAADAAALRHSLRLLDRLLRVVSVVRERPVLVAAAAGIVLLLLPRRIGRVAFRGSALGLSLLRLTRNLRLRPPAPPPGL